MEIHRKVNVVVFGRNIAFDEGSAFACCRARRVQCVFGNGVDVDLAELIVPIDVGIKRAERAAFEVEMVDLQCTPDGRLIKKPCYMGLSGGISAKTYRVEID